jgi:hypothetical protein
VFIAALLGLRTWERRGLMTKAPDTDDVNKQ